MAEEAEPELSGADQFAYLERLESEHDNMRAALSWSLEKESETALRLAVALNREIGNWAYGVYCLEGFAGLAGARGQGARAARLWGAAEALRTNIGVPTPEARPYYERSMAAARAQLGEAAWEAAFAQGMAMSPDEAAEHALGKSDRT